MIDLSICLPAIRPDRWERLYESVKKSCSRHSFELIIISPYDLPKSLKKHSNIKYYKDFSSSTRAAQIGSMFCSGKYIAIPADDGHFFENSFDIVLDQAEKTKEDDVIVLRYREGKACKGPELPKDYWYAKSHLKGLMIDDSWLHAMQPLMRIDFFREIGGFDCSFEHLAFAAHDFSYRAQRSGSVFHLSKVEVMNADHFASTSGDHAPVHHGHMNNDTPLFKGMYSNPSVLTRKKIDFNNWMSASPSWVRRFPDRPKYDLSICVPGIRPQFWGQLYDSVLQAARNYKVQLVFVGPYEPDKKILQNPDVKFVKDFGSPTRCVQIGSIFCEADLFTWASDDGIFANKSIRNAIDKFNTVDKNKDEMVMRYYEAKDRKGKLPPDDYWRAKHHKDNRDLCIPDGTMLAPLGMLRLSYFRELGGFDCRFEHINLSTHDLAFRVQQNGGKIHLSPSVVLECDWTPDATDYKPVRDSYLLNDLPILQQLYQTPTNRIKIDFNNWLNSPNKWRRFN